LTTSRARSGGHGKPFSLLALLVVFLVSCGIDDEPYLAPVPPSNVAVSSNMSARVDGLSNNSDEGEYLLYYKIYLSKESITSTIAPEAMSMINATLSSDYTGIRPYTPLNTSTPQIFSPTVFSSRNFYAIQLGNLGEAFSTLSITLDFANNTDPSLTLSSQARHILNRSDGGGTFTPVPSDRRFRNFSTLGNAQNRDVASTEGWSYSYCAVYIIRRGINPNTLTAVYSAPTFIAVFRLPNEY
jgi:hypothetical protein